MGIMSSNHLLAEQIARTYRGGTAFRISPHRDSRDTLGLEFHTLARHDDVRAHTMAWGGRFEKAHLW